MGLRQLLLLGCLLAFIAPSFQYGTIFTDNVKPAFSDRTLFSGIKSEQVFTTDATIGLIGAENLGGFSVITPGNIVSTSDALSFTSAQIIEFTSSETLNVLSAGSLSIAAQRTDIDGESISFAGEGDVNLRGLSSTVRASYFNLNTTGNAALRGTGDELNLSAPLSIQFLSDDIATVTANNNIVIDSDASFIDYSGQSALFTSNYFSTNGEIGVSMGANQLTIEAKAIVDISSLSTLETYGERFDLLVDSGDINLKGPSGIVFRGQNSVNETLSFTFQSDSNLHLDSKGSTASIIQLDQSGDFKITADNAITFATFFGTSGFTIDSEIDLEFSSNDISNTVVRAQYVAADSLIGTASNTVYVSVPSEDLFIKSATGDISFLAKHDITLTTQDALVGAAVHTYFDTLSELTISSKSALFQQTHPDADSGILQVDVLTQTVLNGTVFEIVTMGSNQFTAGGLYYATGQDVAIVGNKAVDNIQFDTSRQTSINGLDSISYNGEHITISADIFNSFTNNRYSVATYDLELSAEDTTISADTFTIESIRDSVVFDTQGTTTIDAQTFNHVGYNIEFINPSLDVLSTGPVIFNADSSFSWNVANNVIITSPIFTLSASQSAQFLVNTFTETAVLVDLIADSTIYQSENLPSDQLQYVSTDFIVNSDFFNILSGGNVFISNSETTTTGLGSYTISGYSSVLLDISQDLSVFTNAESAFHSQGSLSFDITAQISFLNDASIDIIGPSGEDAFVSFHTNAMNANVDLAYMIFATDILFHATGVTFTDENAFFNLKGTAGLPGNLLIHSEQQDINFLASDSVAINAAGSVIYHSEDELTINAGDAFIVNTAFYDVVSPIHEVTAGSVSFKEGITFVLAGDQFVTEADILSEVYGDQSASFYSGNTLDFTIESAILITSSELLIDGFSLVQYQSNDLLVDAGDSNLSILSGGNSEYILLGDLDISSLAQFDTETFTTRANVGGSISFTAESGEIQQTAKDGKFHFIANSQTIESTVGNVFYGSSGSIVTSAPTTFTAEGVVSGVSSSIEITSFEINGNIVFDSESGSINIAANDDQTIVSDGFGSVTAAMGIYYSLDDTLTAAASENIDIQSFKHTEFQTTENADYFIGDYASFQAARNIRFTSIESTTLLATTEFTVSTGEQGDLNIYSAGDILFNSNNDQNYHSSGDYSWDSTDRYDVIALKDIDLHTTAGTIAITTTEGDLYYVIGNDFHWKSGDDIIANNDGTYFLDSTSNIQSIAEKGDITIDASNDLAFTAETGNIDFQSYGNRDKNVPFEDIVDGVRLSSFDTSFTFSNSFNFYPANSLHFGGQTQPDLIISAAGGPTTTGFTLDSDGHVSLSSTTGIDFAQTNLFINTREFVQFSADNELSIISTNTISVKADAGHIRSHAQEFTVNAETSYTDTATGGYFLFTNDNRQTTTTTELHFDSQSNVVMSGNLLTEDIDESLYGTIGDIILSITNAASFTSNEDHNGSLLFSTGTGSLTMSAKGSITGQVTGPGGSFRVDSGSLSISTLKASDITLRTAGKYDSAIKTTASYTTTTGAVAIASLSVNGADYTNGDISIHAFGGDITLESDDTTDITADGSIYFESSDTILTAIDIVYESFDDTILTGETFDASTSLLFMGNTDDQGGDIHFNTGFTLQPGTIDWEIGDDVNAVFGGNAIGYSEGETYFEANDFTNTDVSISLVSTAIDGDFYFTTQGYHTLDVSVDNQGTLNIGDSIKMVSGLFTEFFSDDIDFTTTNGDFTFNATRGDISASTDESYFNADVGIINIEANGIAPDSNYGILLTGSSRTVGGGDPSGSLLVSGSKGLDIIAYEAVIFETHSHAVVGGPEYLDYQTVTQNSTTKTTFITTGKEANILFNTRVPEDGVVGSISIVATPIIDNIFCFTPDGLSTFPIFSDIGAVNLVASETIRFEQVSGISFEGRFGDFLEDSIADILLPPTFSCSSNYGTDINTDSSDAFFYSQGRYAGIEISASGAFSDIEFFVSAAVFDADQELILGSTGETTSFVEIHSDRGAVNFQVLSTNSTDSIEMHAYNGRIYVNANNYGNILFVPQQGFFLSAVRGIEFESDYVNAAANNIEFNSRSGHINIAANSMIIIADNLVSVNSISDGLINTSVFVSSTSSVINSRQTNILSFGGDIRFDFGRDADFSRVTSMEFSHPNALRLPMKQATIIPGTECQVASQVAVAHNSFLSDGDGFLEGTKDTGIMICWCASTERRWYCRTLSPALPYN